MVKDLQQRIDSFPFWYHKIDIGGIVTPGGMPHRPEAYKLPDDLTGKRVLDIGAWDGYWTFDALKRGAREVVAIDDWSDLPELDKNPRKEWDTFDFCKEVFGYTDERCKRYTMSVYDIKKLGQFDVVFFFGALYHCRYPLLALDKIAEVCTGELYVETAICNDYSPYSKVIGKGYANERDVVMEFYPSDEFGGVSTNWWSPTLICLHWMMTSAGFNTETWKFAFPQEAAFCRGFAKGIKKKGAE